MSTRTTFSLALIAVICLIAFTTNVDARHRKKKPASDASSEDDAAWDFLIFVQHWAPSVCNALPTDGCSIPPKLQDWTIHGLWPENDDGTYPQFCDKKDTFDVAKVRRDRAQLEQAWPGLESGRGRTSETLWSHEWDKHGTCSKSLPALSDEQKYFSQSINLINNYHVGDALAAKNILPSNTKSYTKAQIQQALRNGIGKGQANVVLVCTRGRLPGAKAKSYAAAVSGAGKVAQFTEARMCVDKQFGVITCPDSLQKDGSFNACPSTGIYLPNFNKRPTVGQPEPPLLPAGSCVAMAYYYACVRQYLTKTARVTETTFLWLTQWCDLTYMTTYIDLAFDPILYAYAMPSYREAMRRVWQSVYHFVLWKQRKIY